MSTEVLPSGAEQYDRQRVTTWPIGGNKAVVDTYTGPVAALQTLETTLRASAPAMNGLASTVLTEGKDGRGTLVATYERVTPGNRPPTEEDAVQEFHAIKVYRDIYTSSYFSSLTNAEIVAVRRIFDDQVAPGTTAYATAISGLTDLQKTLLQHLTHGQETIVELAYEFRQTFKTTSDRTLRRSLAGQNTAYTDTQVRAKMNTTTKKLVTGLPTLEWLKDPVELSYLGRGNWAITETYIGLPAWSVIYGGTFTGADPA